MVDQEKVKEFIDAAMALDGMSGRSKNLQCRLTPFEYELICRRANALEMSVSDFMRTLISLPIDFRDVASDDPQPVEMQRRVLVDVNAHERLARSIDRWGVNLNQAAKALNAMAKMMRALDFSSKFDRDRFSYLAQAVEEQLSVVRDAIEYIGTEADDLLTKEPVRITFPLRKRIRKRG